MSIQPGDTIPDTTIQVIDGDIRPAQSAALFAGRKALLFGVPGAFTPTCSNKHLPGYSAHFAEFQQRGISVMCLAVNDGYVMQAWAASQQVPAGLLMLADGKKGLIDGNAGQVLTQLWGCLVCIAWCAIATFILLKIVDALIGLRVTNEEEIEGLDINLHGETVH